MSILVPQSTSAPFSLTGFFASAQGMPVTLAGFFKQPTLNTAAHSTYVIRIGNSTDYYSAEAGANTPGYFISASFHDSTPSAGSRSASLYTSSTNVWMPFVAEFLDSNHPNLYYLDTSGTFQALTSNDYAGVNPANVLDLTLLSGGNNYSDIYAALLTVYQSSVTATQAQEFINTGSISALTPYSRWEALTDWGAGTIADAGSSGTAITPPSGWIFSTDNPTFAPANGIPSLTLEDKTGILMAAGTSVSVTVDTTTGTNVYPKTPLTITSANQIPVIDLSSAVTAGTIANGDTVNYRVDYGGETTIVPQTVTASPT